MNKLMTATAAFLLVAFVSGCGTKTEAVDHDEVAALPANVDGSPVAGESPVTEDLSEPDTSGRGAQRLGGGYCRATCTKKKGGINYYSTRDGFCGGNAFGNCCGSLDITYGTWRSKCFPL